jgi:hypothetical protein
MRRIVDLADGVTSLRQIFRRLDIEPAFQKVNQARVELTTSTSPYLRAIKDDKVEKLDQASKARQLKEASRQKLKSITRKSVISSNP